MDPSRGPTRRQLLHMLGAAAAVGTGFALGLWRKWATAPESQTAAAAPPASTTSSPATTAAPPTTAAPTTTTPPAPTTTTTSTTTTTTGLPPEPVALEVVGRAGWGAGSATGVLPPHTIERITVHHSAGMLTENRDAPGRLLDYQAFHQGRGFVDVAYHFMIDRNGHVYQARDFGIPGETFTDYDPTGHFLPMCDGNFEEQEISAAQFDALVDLIAWAVVNFDVGVDTITGHRDHAATACPGEDLYRTVADGTMATRVAERIASGGVELTLLSDSEAQQRVAAIEAGEA